MRTSRCILYTALGTGLCLVYVFLQTEVVKLGYRITTAQKVLETCRDRNKALDYQLSALESPLSIDKNLFLKNEEYEIAKEFRLVKVSPEGAVPGLSASSGGPRLAKAPARRRFALQTLFASRQAEARTIK